MATTTRREIHFPLGPVTFHDQFLWRKGILHLREAPAAGTRGRARGVSRARCHGGAWALPHRRMSEPLTQLQVRMSDQGQPRLTERQVLSRDKAFDPWAKPAFP